MTKPPSGWRKGDPQVFDRSVPENELSRKRMSCSVEEVVYPKWWPADQGGSGGTGVVKPPSPQPHTFRAKERAHSVEEEAPKREKKKA